MPERLSVFTFFGSNIDGSFTTAVSTFLSPLEKANSCRLRMKFILIWLVGCFGFNGPLRQYFSLYRAVSQREGEGEEKG